MNEQMKVMFMSPTNEIDVDRKNLKQLFHYGHGFLLLTRINFNSSVYDQSHTQ